MLDSRLKTRTYFLNGHVNSVKDHSLRVSARADSLAFFLQHHLPILEGGGTIKGCSREAWNPCGTNTFILTRSSWSDAPGRSDVWMERCKAAWRSILTKSLQVVLMCTWTKDPMETSTSSSRSRVLSHHLAKDGVSIDSHTRAKIPRQWLVDPLGEDNSRYPLSVSPYDFQYPVRAQEMERISFAGQHIR